MPSRFGHDGKLLGGPGNRDTLRRPLLAASLPRTPHSKSDIDTAVGGLVFNAIVLGDPHSVLSTGTDKNLLPLEAPFGLTIVEVRLRVKTAPTGAAIIVDLNVNGVTVFTTQANRPTIAAGASTGVSTAVDLRSLAKGDNLTIDIDQIGSTVAGGKLMVEVVCEQVAH